jgi:Tfp pilus assembly protein PilN
MKKQKKAHLNLATHPLSNRRFFFLLSGILGVLVIATTFFGGYTFLTYSAKNKNFRNNNAQIEKMITDAKREELRLSAQIKDASQIYQDKIDLLNTIILKKSFSWADFLSALEEVLPASCYIESLAPTLKENNQMEVRLKIVAPNLDELLTLNKNLYEKHFTGIRIINEGMNEAGLLIAEITLIYERTI